MGWPGRRWQMRMLSARTIRAADTKRTVFTLFCSTFVVTFSLSLDAWNANLTDRRTEAPGKLAEYVRVEGSGERVEAFDEIGGRGCSKLVSDAVDVALVHGWEAFPASLRDELFEGNAISGPAPCRDNYVGTGVGDGFPVVVAPGVPRTFRLRSPPARQPTAANG